MTKLLLSYHLFHFTLSRISASVFQILFSNLVSMFLFGLFGLAKICCYVTNAKLLFVLSIMLTLAATLFLMQIVVACFGQQQQWYKKISCSYYLN